MRVLYGSWSLSRRAFYTMHEILGISGQNVTTLGQNYLGFPVCYLSTIRVSCVRFGYGCLWCDSYIIRKPENTRGVPYNPLEKCAWRNGRAHERTSRFRMGWWHILVRNLVFSLRCAHCRARVRFVQVTRRARLEEKFHTMHETWGTRRLSVTTLGQKYLYFLAGYFGITRVSSIRFG